LVVGKRTGGQGDKERGDKARGEMEMG